MTSGDQFRASGPPALTGQAYAEAFNEVKLLGAANSVTRTTDQTEIARFWADGAGTITPPGHWNQIAQTVAQSSSLSLVEEARLFALLNIAEADAAILCWDTKYSSNFWRPITAIREADTDGNDLTEQDADWKPLLTTPNFPSYTSGHASFSGAAAAVLAGLTGSDSFTFTAKAHNSVAVADRTFFSFSQAAGEAADSRLYGGIHFDFDNADGLAAGVALGQYVLNSQLQPVPEPATWALYGLGMLTIVGLRLVRSPALR
jgi:membrane-associated phospholipid phosphatase